MREEIKWGQYTGSISYMEEEEWRAKLEIRIRRLLVWRRCVCDARKQRERIKELHKTGKRCWKKIEKLVRTQKPKKGGRWHMEYTPPARPPRATEKHALRQTPEKSYNESRKWERRTEIPQKRAMRRQNGITIGERLRACTDETDSESAVRTHTHMYT